MIFNFSLRQLKLENTIWYEQEPDYTKFWNHPKTLKQIIQDKAIFWSIF